MKWRDRISFAILLTLIGGILLYWWKRYTAARVPAPLHRTTELVVQSGPQEILSPAVVRKIRFPERRVNLQDQIIETPLAAQSEPAKAESVPDTPAEPPISKLQLMEPSSPSPEPIERCQSLPDFPAVPPEKKNERSPEDRGGRPRGPLEPSHRERGTETRPAQPEIVCWLHGSEWQIGLEVAEKQEEKLDCEFIQAGRPLEREYSDPPRWRIESLRENILATWHHDAAAARTEIELTRPPYLIFKLSGEHKEMGRQVHASSTGSYLVIAPQDWQRDLVLSGLPPRRQEPVRADGYVAHFFDMEQGTGQKIAFCDEGGQPRSIPRAAPRFGLIGSRLPCAEPTKGPLFGGAAPRLKLVGDMTWNQVKTIVVGQEGHGRNRWRTSIERRSMPQEQSDADEYPLSAALRTRGGVWYFVRIYDPTEQLIESFDFRYCPGLENITLPSLPPLSAERHAPAQIEFQHDAQYQISAADELSAGLEREPMGDKTIVTIPPESRFDTTHWMICGDESKLELTIRLDRVWWVLGAEAVEPAAWSDQVLAFTRADFAPSKENALWLKLPAPRWANEIRFGIKGDLRRAGMYVNDDCAQIPLRNFYDVLERSPLGTREFWLVLCAAGQTYSAPIGTVQLAAHCPKCEFESLSETELFEHVREGHLDEYFRPMEYRELQHLDSRLSHQIYKCLASSCGYYAELEPLANPTTAMNSHFKHCHPGQSTRFAVVQQASEIRAHVIRDLLNADKCLMPGCEFQIKNPTDRARWQHLREKHASQLYNRV